MSHRSDELSLEWVPREQNEEADALTNEIFDGFALEKRIAVDLGALGFQLLPGLLQELEAFRAALDALRSQGPSVGPRVALLPRKRKDALRLTDPW